MTFLGLGFLVLPVLVVVVCAFALQRAQPGAAVPVLLAALGWFGVVLGLAEGEVLSLTATCFATDVFVHRLPCGLPARSAARPGTRLRLPEWGWAWGAVHALLIPRSLSRRATG